jgi:hypothetical protein
MHRHATTHTTEKCFTGPVAGVRENPAAHGWTTITDTCRCGAERETNTNGRHTERGRWHNERNEL